jgi:hypothetical protein
MRACQKGFVARVADGLENPLVVRGDDGARDRRSLERALDDVQDHRAALYLKKWLARQTARRVARGDDGDDRGVAAGQARVIHGITK